MLPIVIAILAVVFSIVGLTIQVISTRKVLETLVERLPAGSQG
jgi:hypothetical protein